jgi:hypothetical protein
MADPLMVFNQNVLDDLRAEKDFRHADCRGVAEVTP